MEYEFYKKNIDLSGPKSGGLPKDGIPSIDNPVFISQDEAAKWIGNAEPVNTFTHRGKDRAYPLQTTDLVNSLSYNLLSTLLLGHCI